MFITFYTFLSKLILIQSCPVHSKSLRVSILKLVLQTGYQKWMVGKEWNFYSTEKNAHSNFSLNQVQLDAERIFETKPFSLGSAFSLLTILCQRADNKWIVTQPNVRSKVDSNTVCHSVFVRNGHRKSPVSRTFNRPTCKE